MLKAYSKNGNEIIGTYDILPAIAQANVIKETNSSAIEIEYKGQTDILWDEQYIKRFGDSISGERYFVDSIGEIWIESELYWVKYK
jgi:hypothetical protein